MPARVSIALLDDVAISRLHEAHLGDPATTDVLSFDLRDPASPPGAFDAELAIGFEVAAREARRRGLPLERELALYVVHGLLHLAGFDDRDPRDRARMRAAERRVLARARERR